MTRNINTIAKAGRSFRNNKRTKGLELRTAWLAIHHPGKTWLTLNHSTKSHLCETLPWKNNE